MKTTLTQHEREKLFALAEKNGWPRSVIAKQIGTTGDNLDKMIKRKSQNSRYLGKLDQWLTAKAHLSPDDFLNAPVEFAGETIPIKRGTMWHEGQKLIDVGRLLQDPESSTKWKLSRYEQFLKAAVADLDRFQAECLRVGE
jgi:hypothetical protein